MQCVCSFSYKERCVAFAYEAGTRLCEASAGNTSPATRCIADVCVYLQCNLRSAKLLCWEKGKNRSYFSSSDALCRVCCGNDGVKRGVHPSYSDPIPHYAFTAESRFDCHDTELEVEKNNSTKTTNKQQQQQTSSKDPKEKEKRNNTLKQEYLPIHIYILHSELSSHCTSSASYFVLPSYYI